MVSEKYDTRANMSFEEQKDFDAAMAAMKGVPTYEAGVLWRRYLTPGHDYAGSPKWRMARDFAQRTTIGKRHCLHISVDKILAAMAKRKTK